jgi:ferritin-like metal-binding protein YciE
LTDNPKITVGSEKIQLFFIEHLNRVYCAKSHLAERLPEIYEGAGFADLKHAIKETILSTEKQLSRIDQIFELLGIKYSFEKCQTLINFLENSFADLQLSTDQLQIRDLMIVSYLYQLDSVEMAAAQILQFVANGITNQQIKQLLKDNYNEAKAESALLLLLIEKYS